MSRPEPASEREALLEALEQNKAVAKAAQDQALLLAETLGKVVDLNDTAIAFHRTPGRS
ncbi:hypothetical protein ACLIYM_25295 [Streptomyces fenghuangensis]